MINIPARITALRAMMAAHKVDAYMIPTADPHQSEYVPDRWSHRYWISGFGGSAATVIVSGKHAGLWTDSRYFLQAEQELKGTGIELHKLKVQTQAEYVEWLCNHLQKGQTVGCDFWCFSYAQVRIFDKIFSEKGIILKDTGDLIDKIWEDRPKINVDPVYDHPAKFAGSRREEKLKKLRAQLKLQKTDYLILSALDEIAWLLNLRGSDVRCNPVFLAYLIVSKDTAVLFVPDHKIDAKLQEKLTASGVSIRMYAEIEDALRALPKNAVVQFDPGGLNAKLSLTLAPDAMKEDVSPVMLMKSCKSTNEQNHIRKVMEKDGVALIRAFIWLEKGLKKKKLITEHDFAMQIAHFRSQQSHYVGESFDAIVGYNSNGAIIHYKPHAENSARIKPKGILLIDSGGQYMDGTTDITRTIALSKPGLEFKKQYTAVLMGHIALSDAVFPEGTKGIQLDALARQYLWKMGLNYGHGTGHGVGYFMNVHEPPQGFVSAWNQRGQTGMLEGMLTSNEPGFYKEGSYGIRIENLVLNALHSKQGDLRFLKFETVSLFPIDTHLIHMPIMNKQAVDWLNSYHKQVYKRLSPHLDASEKKWLKGKCREI
ncbi:MAG: aminopeptidase P family protein [Saprospiraceae bacterium]|nr:aminopeptidase P family protein [Saprospiraceae bacterium]